MAERNRSHPAPTLACLVIATYHATLENGIGYLPWKDARDMQDEPNRTKDEEVPRQKRVRKSTTEQVSRVVVPIEMNSETVGAAERWRVAASSDGLSDGENVPDLANDAKIG